MGTEVVAKSLYGEVEGQAEAATWMTAGKLRHFICSLHIQDGI